jgi:hypothetical protein
MLHAKAAMEKATIAYLPTPIVGEKVTIRSLSEGDLDRLYALEIDEDVKRYVGGTVKGPREEWIAGMRRNLDLLLCVTVKATGDFAGRASLTQPGLPSEEAGLQVLRANTGALVLVAKRPSC